MAQGDGGNEPYDPGPKGVSVDLELMGIVIAASSAIAATVGLGLNASKASRELRDTHSAEHKWRARVDAKLDAINESVTELRDTAKVNADSIHRLKERQSRMEVRIEHLEADVDRIKKHEG